MAFNGPFAKTVRDERDRGLTDGVGVDGRRRDLRETAPASAGQYNVDRAPGWQVGRSTRKDNSGGDGRRGSGSSSSINFEWVDNVGNTRKYNWDVTRRDEYSMSRRVDDAWNDLGATRRVNENGGAYTQLDAQQMDRTRRSPRDDVQVVRATVMQGDWPDMAQSRMDGDFRSTKINGDYHRTGREEDFRKTVTDEEFRKTERKRWVSMAANEQEMNHWHQMFSQMRTKYNNAEWVSSAEKNSTVPLYSSGKDTGTTSFDDGSTDGRTNGQRFKCAVLIGIVALLVIVAVLVPTLVLTRTEDKADQVVESYNIVSRITNWNYTDDMADNSSTTFLDVAESFCQQVDNNLQRDNQTSDDYEGCIVTSMRNGSLIITFTVVLSPGRQGKLAKETIIKIIFTITNDTVAATVKLGTFEIEVASVTVNTSVTLKAVASPVVKSISINDTCARNNRRKCRTVGAICSNGVCGCNENSPYNSQSDACKMYRCDEIPSIVNGQATKQQNGNTKSLTIICNSGYKIQGTDSLTCSGNRWGNLPLCIPVKCSAPEMVQNGNLDINTTITHGFMTNATVTCNEGYEVDGTSTMSCLANGTWSGTLACKRVKCLPLSTPMNGQIDLNQTSIPQYMDNATVSCNNGFEVVGDHVATCLANATWSSVGSCNPIVCDEFTYPDNSDQKAAGTDIETNVSFVQSVNVSCQDGYQLSGNSTFSCDANGTWPSVECSQISCNITEINPSNGKIVPINDSAILVECNDGYQLDNNSLVTCENGSWTIMPTCSIVNCSEFSPGEGAIIANESYNFTFGSVVSVGCKVGYKLSSSSSTETCTETGAWTNDTSCVIEDCGIYAYPDYSQPTMDSNATTTYGSVLDIQCDDGYSLEGNSSVECEVGEVWSASPVCNEIVCGPVEVADGSVMPSQANYSVNSSLEVECNIGFQTNESRPLICQVNGTWNGTPECTAITCPQLGVPTNGQLDVNQSSESVYRDNATVSCSTGYEVDGADSITCQADGTWSGSLGCKPIMCPTLDSLDNGEYLSATNETAYNESVGATCNEGFMLSGPELVTCTANGSWTETPVCSPVICKDFVHPDNSYSARENVSGLKFNDAIAIECDDGYQISGESETVCQANSTWSPLGSCDPIICDEFTYPDNSDQKAAGTDIETNVSFIQSVNVSCQDGYELIGDSTFSCDANGTWPSVECNQIICNITELNPSNGKIVPINDSAVQVECNDGYRLDNNSLVTCENGSWTIMSTCSIVNCSEFSPGEDAIIANESYNFTFGSVVSVGCKVGYKLSSSSSTETCTGTGAWTNDTSCVIEDCGDYTYPDSSKSSQDSNATTTYGSVLDIECDDGYSLEGNSSVECEAGEVWSASPVCNEIVCGPVEVADGSVMPSQANYSVNSSVDVECNIGFQTNESRPLICQVNGTWNGTPECTAITCPQLSVPTNGQLDVNQSSESVYRDNATVSCSTGYEVDGADTITCRADGTWNGSLGCTPIMCPTLDSLDNGEYLSATNETAYNESVGASCNEGFMLSGPELVTCNADGSWTETPVCSPVICQDFVHPDNSYTARENVSGLTFNDTIAIECDDGYHISGESETVCQANSTWSPLGSCDPIICDEFTYPDNSDQKATGTAIETNVSFIQSVNVSCQDGYELIGDSTFSCDANGTWPSVECSQISCNITELKPSNGKIVLINDSAVQVECNDGYRLDNNSLVTCENGSWTIMPTCSIVNCSEFSPGEDAIIANESYNFTFGSVVSVGCKVGYKLSSSSSTETCTGTGAWTNDTSCVIEDCGYYTYPDSSKSSQDSNATTTYGSVLDIECDDGYSLEGNSSVECEAGEVWSASPVCNEIVCGPVEVADGSVMPSQANYSVNSSVDVECNIGFQTNESRPLICQVNGTWNGTPECTAITCPQLGVPTNGQLDVNQSSESVYRDNATVSCSTGYEVDGADTITCQADGTWSGSLGCKPIMCPTLDSLDNGEYLSATNETAYNESVGASCNEGFMLSGPELVTCNADGSWTETPVCSPVICQDFVHPDNSYSARENVSGLTFNDTIAIECDDGYHISGESETVCQANSTWSPLGSCDPIICDDFTYPDNSDQKAGGTDIETNVSFIQSVNVSCQGGYELIGDSTFSCDANGTWPSVECSQISCNITELNPSNGKIVLINDSAVQVECNDGYRLDNNSLVTCENGSWTIMPTCSIVNCSEFSPGEDAIIANESYNFTFGSVVSVGCKVGYKLSSSSSTETCTGTGAWTNDTSCVIEDCGDYTYPDSSKSSKDSNATTTYGSVLDIECDDGYSLEGNSSVECEADEVWSASPVCNEIVCGPVEVADGSVMPSQANYSVNSSLEVECNIGFQTNESRPLTCQVNGTWNGTPECTAITCPKLGVPTNGQLDVNQSSESVYRDNATVSCSTGYEVDGADTITCQADGTWSGSLGCKPIMCPTLDSLDNGEYLSATNETAYNESVGASCNEGFMLSGPELVTCNADGSWTETPVCSPVICQDFVHPDNSYSARENVSGLTFNDTIAIECDDGYQISGESETVCQANSTWSPLSSCDPIICDDFTYPDNSDQKAAGADIETNVSFIQSVNVSCQDGYQLIGDSTFSCDAIGTWPSVKCSQISCNITEINPSNGKIVPINDSAIQVECNDGYQLDNNSLVTCENGSWTIMPTCSIVNCSEFSPGEDAIIANESYNFTFGSVVSVGCKVGYKLSSSSSTETCTGTGAWTNDTSCVIEDCGIYAYPDYSQPTMDSNATTTYGSVLDIECDDGYSLEGNSSVECEVGEVWSASPVCNEILCGPVEIADGNVTPFQANYSVNSSVTAQCNHGFKISGNETLTCSADGSWTSSVNCSRIDAPVLTLTYMIVEDQDGWADRVSSCAADLGDTPVGHLDVELGTHGTFVSIFNETHRNDQKVAEVYQPCNKSSSEPCNNDLLQFYFVNVSMEIQAKEVRCVIRADDDMSVEPIAVSEAQSIYVLAADFCDDKTIGQTYAHPYSCSSFVVCSTTVNSCSSDECFDVDADGCQNCSMVDCQISTPTQAPTTTTMDPTASYIVSQEPSKGGLVNTDVIIQIGLNNIEQVTMLSVTSDDGDVNSTITDETGITSVTFNHAAAGSSIYVSVQLDTNEILVNFSRVSCKLEDSYTVKVNNDTSETISVIAQTPTEVPTLDIPETVSFQQRSVFSCSGVLGRLGANQPATKLALQRQNPDSTVFADFSTDAVMTFDESDDCAINGSLDVEVFPTSEWNNSRFRCVSKDTNDSIIETSAERAVRLSEPNIRFMVLSETAYIGSRANLSCHVENVASLSSIEITAGDNRMVVASLTESGSESADGVMVLHSSSLSSTGGSLVAEISSTSCSDLGDYYCSYGNVVSKDTLDLTRLPTEPTLTLSRQIIENQDTWADRPFICEGDVGYPPGYLDVEINKDGEFVSIFADASTATKVVDYPGNCSSNAKLEFGLKGITLDMHESVLRCIVRNVTGEETTLYTNGQYINVVTASYCTSKTGLIAHPYSCSSYISCKDAGGINGIVSCGDLCFSPATKSCASCDTAGCSVSTPPPPGTPVLTCTLNNGQGQPQMGDTGVTIGCSVTNFNFSAAHICVINGDSVEVLSSIEPNNANNSMDLNVAADDSLTVTFGTIDCNHKSEWTISASYENSDTNVESVLEVNPTTAAEVPTLTTVPDTFIVDSEMTLTCSGYIGNPKEDNSLVVKYREGSTGDYLDESAAVVSPDQFDTNKCSAQARVTHTFTVTSDMTGTEYRCDTTTANGTVLTSEVTTVEVQGPVVSIDIPNETVQIGESLTLNCNVTLGDTIIGVALYKEQTNGEPPEKASYDGSTAQSGESASFDNGVLTFSKPAAECSDEGDYICQPLSADGPVAGLVSRGNLGLTRPPGTPALTLPIPIFEDVATSAWGNQLTCTADIGYPRATKVLKVEILASDGGTFQDFSLGTIEEPNYDDPTDCSVSAQVSFNAMTFGAERNNSQVRCAVYEDDTATIPLVTSPSQTVQILTETCSDLNQHGLDNFYYWYLFDCHKYLQCYTGQYSVGECPVGTCPNIEGFNSTSPNCATCPETCT